MFPLTLVESVRTVFVELFCTPKGLMEHPSLRVSGHVSSMNRTFIVEDYAEDDFGQWDTDEVTCEQGYIDDERSCFCLAVQTIQGPPGEKKGREKEKAKDDPKGPEEFSLAMSERKIPNGGKKRTHFGGPREREARRAHQKAMTVFRSVVFALTSSTKVQTRIFPKTKAEKGSKRKRQRKNHSEIRIRSLRNTQ